MKELSCFQTKHNPQKRPKHHIQLATVVKNTKESEILQDSENLKA